MGYAEAEFVIRNCGNPPAIPYPVLLKVRTYVSRIHAFRNVIHHFPSYQSKTAARPNVRNDMGWLLLGTYQNKGT